MEHFILLFQHIVKLTLFWESFELLFFFSIVYSTEVINWRVIPPDTQGIFYCEGKVSSLLIFGKRKV